MKASLIYGSYDVKYEEIDTPTISDEEVLVKVDTALTCGTDLKTYKRGGHPKLIKSTPSVFGHQLSGTIVEAGKLVKNFKDGDRVVPLNTAPCFECRFCKRERYSLCENLFFLNGAYAEYIKIPKRILENNTYKINDSLSFEVAAIAESLAVVLHGIHRSNIQSKDTVCVIGTGSIGLLFTLLASRMGAKVIAIGRKEEKLQASKTLGASHALINSKDIVSSIEDLTDGYGADIVIEATGNPKIWELSTRLASRGGTINFFGGCKQGSSVEFDTYRLHYDELNLIGVFHHTPKHVKEAISLLPKIEEKIRSGIITHSLPLSKLSDAFKLQEEGKALQVAIKCDINN